VVIGSWSIAIDTEVQNLQAVFLCCCCVVF